MGLLDSIVDTAGDLLGIQRACPHEHAHARNPDEKRCCHDCGKEDVSPEKPHARWREADRVVEMLSKGQPDAFVRQIREMVDTRTEEELAQISIYL